MSHNRSGSASDVGWLIIAPDGQPYAWYTYDTVLSHDADSTMARFEPDPQLRHNLLAQGWTVVPGSGAELTRAAADYAKASA
ncbi:MULTISPECIES: hypothetical protein [Mycobacterium]|uniref:Uncharacterized protein n=2 Tax=Mycobacterium TaxID=1763 RepID=A0A1X1XB14_9MYCO|nr:MULTISPECIES: hypothetical protein [Mycobacterium]ORV96047.1 hypothetical protein AWC14_17260 [Mycobacterium kyorinense]PBJ41365.1 hypothetical protein XV03_00435 [Mycobacterium avium subsp. hominissuis]PBJ67455.1 hypothetical protein BB737_01985 [Mycobacterium avium subsp. hominissuis]